MAQSWRMQPSPPPRIRLAPLLPRALRPWAQPLEPALWKLLVPAELMEGVVQARRCGTGAGFAQSLLDALDIRFNLDEVDRKRIPSTGPAVVVANHPYGIVEGLILAAVLD